MHIFSFFSFYFYHLLFSLVQLSCQCACVFVNSTTCVSVRVSAVGHKFDTYVWLCVSNTFQYTGAIFVCRQYTSVVYIHVCVYLSLYINVCAKWMYCEALNGSMENLPWEKRISNFFSFASMDFVVWWNAPKENAEENPQNGHNRHNLADFVGQNVRTVHIPLCK